MCLERGITLQAQYIPGEINISADFMSHHLRERTDWILNPALFRHINHAWVPLQVDLFATRFSTQPPRFFSWHPDPEAEVTDAILQDWRNLQGYAHPPWCLIARVLIKVQGQQLANTGMVPSVAGNARGLSADSLCRLSQVSSTSAFSKLRLPSSAQSTAVGCTEGLRCQFKAEAIPEDVIELILALWRENTNTTYNSTWHKWEPWCSFQDTHPFSANPADIL